MNKEIRLSVRVTEAQKQAFQRVARHRGLSLSSWVIMSLIEVTNLAEWEIHDKLKKRVKK